MCAKFGGTRVFLADRLPSRGRTAHFDCLERGDRPPCSAVPPAGHASRARHRNGSRVSKTVAPQAVTFRILAESASTEAADALLAALTVDDAECRRLGAEGVVRQRSQLTILNLIRRIDDLPDDVCASLARQPDRFEAPLKQCFQRGDKTDLRAATEFSRRCGCIRHFADAIGLLEHWNEDIRDAASDCVRGLAEAVALRLLTSDAANLPCIDFNHCRALRIELLNDLGRVLFQFDHLMNPQPAVDAVLILGRPDDEEVKNVCSKYGSECAEMATETLQTMKSLPVFDAVCEALKLLAPLPVFPKVLSQRDDPEFVLALLKWWPKRVTTYVETNIKRAGTIPWLNIEHPTLEKIPTTLHDQLVSLLNCTELERDDKNELKKWVVRHSSGSGRAAATDVLNWLPRKEVQHILYEALLDPDTEVEAWATQQLRSQKVPDTFGHLLERLDSDRPQVRDAAREELASFNIERVFDLFGSLPPSTCHHCGQLLQKINPHVLEDFREELQHAFHWRRVRATRAVGELGLVDELLPSLSALLEEPEWSIRRAVIESLSHSDSESALKIIRSMASDEQRQVREAVEVAVLTIQQRQAAPQATNATA